MPSSITDEDLEMEMDEIDEMDDEDFMDYGIKIKQESDLLELPDDSDEPEEIEYAKPGVSTIPSMAMFRGTLPANESNGIHMQGSSQQREPTYTLDMHLFHKRKDKPPLYLLNPDDYQDDPQKQLQIRRATITYRHHQEKKELIRRLSEENANLKSVLEIYSQREDAMAEFCTCESAKKIIKDFNPKSFLIVPPPPQKLAPLPPLRRSYARQDLNPTMNHLLGRPNGVAQSWNQAGQNGPASSRTLILRKNTGAQQPSGSVYQVQSSQTQAEKIIRLHQERLNRMQSPVQQAKNPLPLMKTDSSSLQSGGGSNQNLEVQKILQQMSYAQIRLEMENNKSGNTLEQSQPQTSGSVQIKQQPSGSTIPTQIAFRNGPQISSAVLARSGIRIQTPNGVRILSPSSNIKYLPRGVVSQIPGTRYTIVPQSGIRMAPRPSSGFTVIPRPNMYNRVPGTSSIVRPNQLVKLPSGEKLVLNSTAPEKKIISKSLSNLIDESKSRTENVQEIVTNKTLKLLTPKSEPIDIVDVDLNESEISPPQCPQPQLNKESVSQVQHNHPVSSSSPVRFETKETGLCSTGPMKAELPKVRSLNHQDMTSPKAFINGLNLLEEERQEEFDATKIKQEPLDDNSLVHQRRSQRSSALCQPNAKELLKGIIKKIPRGSTGSNANNSREDLTYGKSTTVAKKRKITP